MSGESDRPRVEAFRRNYELESLLGELNDELWLAERSCLGDERMPFPPIFIVGPHRSGSTLLMQWLATLGPFAYPSNLLSRFYKAPIIGAKIQLLLTDERYNFRNEILDFRTSVDFASHNGKTSGAQAPNEFWYFWRRFLPFDELDYLPSEELEHRVDGATLRAELAGVSRVLGRPLAMKALILNFNIDYLARLFDNAIFIHSHREPLSNIASGLDARLRQYGNLEQWYSFKIPQYEALRTLSPHEQVAGQVYHINRAVGQGLAALPEQRRMVVDYEGFCANPESYYQMLRERLAAAGHAIPAQYTGPERFETTRPVVDDPKVAAAWSKFQSGEL